MKSILLFLLSLFTLSLSLSHGLRTELNHIDAGGEFTNVELMQRMVHRSKSRARYLASNPNSLSTQSHISNGEYLITLSIGTPPQPLALTLDTGSDLLWTQCQPCVTCFKQPLPIYNSSKSSTFSSSSCDSELCAVLPNAQCPNKKCSYKYSYADKSVSQGILGNETFTFGSTAVKNIGFGCASLSTGIFNSNESGISGFGRGPLSVISQLSYGNFSYCFTSVGESKSSPVFIGDATNFMRGSNGKIQSTPFVANPADSSYFLTLSGITVGTMLLNIPKSIFALKADGTGGVIIDSGTGITQFPEPAYSQVLTAFLSQVKLPVVNGSADLCFGFSTSQNIAVPKFTFHFEGADWELPKENYMLQDPSSKTICLAMGNSSALGLDITLIGNFQQQNFHVLYDLKGGKLSFVPAQCDQL